MTENVNRRLRALVIIGLCAALAISKADVAVSEDPSAAIEFRWEDPDRLSRDWNMQPNPDDYLHSLESTGMGEAVSSGSMRSSGWTPLGPVGGFGRDLKYNGRVASVRVVPTAGGYYVFAGACGGGLWRMLSQTTFRSNSLQWTNLGSSLPNPSIGAFVVDPSDVDHIVVGTGDPARYKGSGIYYTTNGGGSWTASTIDVSPPSDFYRMEFKMGNPNVLVAACSAGILRSNDGGESWIRVRTGNVTDMRRHPTQASTFYAVERETGFLRSTDSGQTWDTIAGSSGLPPAPSFSRASMDICRDSPETLVLVLEDGSEGANGGLLGVWRTTDGGVQWNDIGSNMQDISGGQMGHAQAVAIKPDDPSVIYVGGADLAATDDAGTTWSYDLERTGPVIGHSDVTQLHFASASGDNTLWISNDGGLYRNSVGGNSVGMNGSPPDGLVISQIGKVDADRSLQVIGLQDNGQLRSVDTGSTWSGFDLGDGSEIAIADPENNNFWYWIGLGWRLKRKHGEANQENMQVPDDTSASLFYDSFDDKILVPTGPEIFSMSENGAPGSWVEETGIGPLHSGSYNIRRIWGSRADGKTLYVQFREAALRRDISVAKWTGTGWNVIETSDLASEDGSVISAAPSRTWPGEAWIGCSGSIGDAKVFHTTDYGVNWEDVTGELEDVTNVYTLAPTPFDPLVIYAGTEIGIFRTTDGGQSWHPFQSGLPIVRCNDLEYVVDHTSGGAHKLVAATNGRGLWTRDVHGDPVIFVDKDSNGFEDGTFQHPFNTVSEGIAAAAAGSIVAVRANTYEEPQTVDGNVRLVSYAGDTVIG